MTISEESRNRLYQRLEAVLGHEEATVLMEHLPPVGWADVATKRDLDALEGRNDLRFQSVERRLDEGGDRLDRIDGRLDRIDGRLDRIDGRLDRIDDRFDQLRAELRTYLIAVMSMTVVFGGAVIAAVKL